jgi:predicted nucleotidyltransferase
VRFGLDDKIINRLISVLSGAQYVRRAVIFGSRARGDFRYNSDIDIALYTDGRPVGEMFLEMDDAAGIYKTNILVMDNHLDEKLRRNIEQDGVEIYKRADI